MSEDIIAVDIGGSHISSLLVNQSDQGYVLGSEVFTTKVDSQNSSAEILSDWQQHLTETIRHSSNFSGKIAVAMPGPFDYDTGIAHFQTGQKFASLQNANIREAFIDIGNGVKTVAFVNDAAAFGLGASKSLEINANKVIALTLGTGIGSAFINNGRLLTTGLGVPEGGEVYSLPFRDGIADDYFSTRWFINEAKAKHHLTVNGVKELISVAPPPILMEIFSAFNTNLQAFLKAIIDNFQPDALLIGGNIARAWTHFAPELTNWLSSQEIAIQQVLDGETYACLGAATACFPFVHTTSPS